MKSCQTLSFMTSSLIEHLHTLESTEACVGGIVVSIAAFQAVDPGSIPGQRNKPSLHARDAIPILAEPAVFRQSLNDHARCKFGSW